MVERAMNLKIKPSDIKFLVTEVEKLHGTDADKGYETQAFILMRRHGKKPAKVFAILERMHCLLALMEDDRMRGWTLESDEPGCTLTHEAVFDATATCQLRDKDGHFSFNSDEFFRACAEVQGSGGPGIAHDNPASRSLRSVALGYTPTPCCIGT